MAEDNQEIDNKMALEHNLIYYATRANSAKEVSEIPEERNYVSFAIPKVRTLLDIRKKADSLGLSMPILLRRMADPDEIYDIISDDSYSFANEKVTLTKLQDSVNKVKLAATEQGVRAPMIATNYYAVVYSSYVKHVQEVDNLGLDQVEGVTPNA